MTFQSAYSDVQVSEELVSRKTAMPPGMVGIFDLDGKLIPLGYAPENVALKEVVALDNSTMKYPCNKVVNDAINAIGGGDNLLLSIIF